MKYWIACLRNQAFSEVDRLWFVTENEDQKSGLTKVSEKSEMSDETFETWVQSDQIKQNQTIWVSPVDNSTKENYRCVLVGIDLFKDRTDIERFAMNGYRATIQWFEVSEEIFNWLDGSGWTDAVLELLSDPKLDFKSEISKDHWLSSDDKMMLDVRLHRRIKYPPRVSIALVGKLKEKNIPTEIISFLVA